MWRGGARTDGINEGGRGEGGKMTHSTRESAGEAGGPAICNGRQREGATRLSADAYSSRGRGRGGRGGGMVGFEYLYAGEGWGREEGQGAGGNGLRVGRPEGGGGSFECGKGEGGRRCGVAGKNAGGAGIDALEGDRFFPAEDQ